MPSLIDIARTVGGRWSPFPSVTILGAYHHFSQSITLFDVTSDDFRAAFVQDDFAAKKKVKPLLVHEYTHMADHLGTLWGRKAWADALHAMSARMSGNQSKLSVVGVFIKDVSRYDYSDYYTYYWEDKVPESLEDRPWRYQLTMGKEIRRDGSEDSSRPICFTRFAQRNGHDFVRVPFSISSLLEVRAMAAEMQAMRSVISEIEDEDVRLVEEGLFKHNILQTLYDPLSVKYTVAAHLIANNLGISDAVLAFRLGSYLADLCLMIPTKYFESISLPRELLDSPWADYLPAFVGVTDRSVLFVVLAYWAKEIVPDISDESSWLDDVLAAASLPSADMLYKEGIEEAMSLSKPDCDGVYQQRYDDLLPISDSLLKLRKPCQIQKLSTDKMPPLLLKDDKFLKLENCFEGPTFREPAEWHRTVNMAYNQIVEFIEATSW